MVRAVLCVLWVLSLCACSDTRRPDAGSGGTDAGAAGQGGTPGQGGSGKSGGQAGYRSVLDDGGPTDAGLAPVDAASDAPSQDAGAPADAGTGSDAAGDASPDAGQGCPADLPADCLGVCGGDAVQDDCGECDGDNAAKDCAGVCNGDAVLDCLGVCGGGAACALPVSGTLIVSEVMFNPVTVDDTAGEWFELLNISDHALDLQGCSIADNAASVIIAAELRMPAGGFATFARGGSPGFTPSFDFGTNTLQLSNTGDRIVVTCGGVEVETFEYVATSFAATPGASLSITPAALTAAAHGDPAHWCSSSISYNGDFGTPGGANPSCTPAAPVAAGDLVISELMINPNATADEVGEWIELYNPGLVPLELNGCAIGDDGQDGHTIASSLVIAPRGYRTLAASAGAGFSASYVYPRAEFALANGADEVVLACGGTEIDRVVYDSSFGFVAGRALALDPGQLNAAQNDAASAWCSAVTSFNVDYGTPNAGNPSCAN